MKLLNFLFGGIVYRLGRQPFTLESRVRFPVPLPFLLSSIRRYRLSVRTPASHAGKPGSIPGAATNAKSVAPFLGKWSGATFFVTRHKRINKKSYARKKCELMSDINSHAASCIYMRHPSSLFCIDN